MANKVVFLSVAPFTLLTVHLVTLLKLFIWSEVLRVETKVRSDVVSQIPGLVFIMHHKEQCKLPLHVTPLPIGTLPTLQSPRPAYHQRPQKAAVQILNINKHLIRIKSNTSTPA